MILHTFKYNREYSTIPGNNYAMIDKLIFLVAGAGAGAGAAAAGAGAAGGGGPLVGLEGR